MQSPSLPFTPSTQAYIAGPFRAKDPADHWQVHKNILEAEALGMRVAQELGAFPVIPHTNTGHFQGALPDAFFLEGTLETMRRCDIVVVTERWEESAGARNEVREAVERGMTVLGWRDGVLSRYTYLATGRGWEALPTDPYALRQALADL